jgi:hypothetical protein
MAYKYSGRIIRAGKAWTDNDQTTHPANWASAWDADTKAAIGVVWEDDPDNSFDGRFYWSAGVPKALDDVNEVDENGDPLLDDDGQQLITKGLKTNAIELVKRQAGGLLAPTDWMVIKAAEVADYSLPTDVATARAAIRTASNTIEASITGAADHAAFMALYNTPVDADGNPTGNAPINDWPEEV